MLAHQLTFQRTHENHAHIHYAGRVMGVLSAMPEALDAIERIFTRGAGALWEEHIGHSDVPGQLTFDWDSP